MSRKDITDDKDLLDGSMENLLRYAQLHFELFHGDLVKRAVKRLFNYPDLTNAKEILDGYPIIDYLICTAILLASSFDSDAVVASGLLLYDPLCNKKPNDSLLNVLFRSEVVDLVRDVSKLIEWSRISREGPQRNSEHIQDSILNMVQDPRAVVIKIALRTVQMIFLDSYNPKRKQSLVNETLDLYVPLLEKLGFSSWKSELENLCDSVSDHELMKLYESVSEYDVDGIAFEAKVKKAIQEEISWACLVASYKKSLHNIQNKMSRKNITFSEIKDIICLRITTRTVDQCYRAKDVVENIWNAEQEFEKDYIKYPKPFRDERLKVIVKNGNHQYMKVEIRSDKMHRINYNDSYWAYEYRDMHVPPENVKLLVEFASRLKNSEIGNTSISILDDFLRDAKYEVLKSELVRKAAMFASRTQKEKVLLGTYPVIEHLISIAIHLASKFNSDIMVASGLLLYGSLRDKKRQDNELEKEFGKEVAKEVAKLVEDVLKLSNLTEFSRKEQLENAGLFPDLILAMGVDARAVAIKIAECIVQMTVLDKLNIEKKGFMNEIKYVHIPLSGRLGFNAWKSQLENLCIYEEDDKVKKVYESVSEKDTDGIPFKEKLQNALKEKNIPYVHVEFRKKSFLSLLKKVSKDKEEQKKMSTDSEEQNKISNKKEQKKMSEVEENDILENIKDILGMRIIIEDKENEAKEDLRKRCNGVKDVVANLWTLQYVKDFFETPNNGYESLHVIAKNPNNHYMEVQIRTNQMHKKINDGHWVYKEGNKVPEHVKMLVEMGRWTIEQSKKVPLFVLVEDENKVTKIEERPFGTKLKDLCLERGLEGPLWGRVLVNEAYAGRSYTLETGDIVKFPILSKSK